MRQLGIFAKFWEPGRVKTRLAASLGAEPASRVYFRCLECLLDRLANVAECRKLLCFAPADRAAEFEQLAAGRYVCRPQSGGDLGARMHGYFAAALDAGCERTVLLGSDSPNVPRALIEQAFAALDEYQVVLGPSDDGGYWLVGMRAPVPAIFSEIPWSTPDVWEATTQRLNKLGVSWTALPDWYDVDDEASLARLVAELEEKADEPALVRLRDRLRGIVS